MATILTNPLTRILTGLIFVLVAILVMELFFIRLDVNTEVHSDPDEFPEVTMLEEFRGISAIEDYQTTINRSLFNWDRKPKNVVVGQGEEGDLTTRWLLTGVVNTANEGYAIFSSNSGPERLRLQQGMFLERWRIDAISEDQVTLSSDGKTQVFRLKEIASNNPASSTMKTREGKVNQEKPQNKP